MCTWNNEYYISQLAKEEEFKKEDSHVFKLEKFKQNLSHYQASWVFQSWNAIRLGNGETRNYNKIIEWEATKSLEGDKNE